MNMRDAILDFPKQFAFEPQILNSKNFFAAKKFVVCGVGGSQLGADLIKCWDPTLDIVTHRDYGLPALSDEDLAGRLIILSSYSGDTEETIDSLKMALDKGLYVVVVTTGGELLNIAHQKNLPFIQIPNTGIQPRCAMGFNVKALLKIIGTPAGFNQAHALEKHLDVKEMEPVGKELAAKLNGFVPVIYASNRNSAVAYNWKIKLNETGKVPAFCNSIPELNHNEMNAFDALSGTEKLTKQFYFIFLRDSKDAPKIQQRMDILHKLYEERGLSVTEVVIQGVTPMEALFNSTLLADWVAYHTALLNNADPNEVPMVQEFKKLLVK